jgi:hypothetical protein
MFQDRVHCYHKFEAGYLSRHHDTLVLIRRGLDEEKVWTVSSGNCQHNFHTEEISG